MNGFVLPSDLRIDVLWGAELCGCQLALEDKRDKLVPLWKTRVILAVLEYDHRANDVLSRMSYGAVENALGIGTNLLTVGTPCDLELGLWFVSDLLTNLVWCYTHNRSNTVRSSPHQEHRSNL